MRAHMNTNLLSRQTVKLGHRQRGTTGQVWVGGSGPAVVLLHGGWAGARAHWSPVWEALARHHRVIAPELPGVVPDTGSGDAKGHYADYADWVVDLMDALQCESAVVVGNSLGATIAWYLAIQHPARCRALVMVDGVPPPPLPGWLRFLLLNSALARHVAQRRLRREAYSRQALESAFHDDSKVPDEIRYALGTADERTIAQALAMVLRSAVPASVPRQPALVVWGAQDRVPRAEPAVGRELHERLPGSRLALIEQAGHLPQVEQPQAFLEAVMPFVALAG